MNRSFRLVMMVLACVVLAACTRVLSDEARRLVDPTVTFAGLKANPDAFLGKYVMLGGVIVDTKNNSDGGQIEVMQVGLDESGIPGDTFRSEGRFLATSAQFLDAVIFKPGRLVTLVGEIKGKKVQPLDEVNYSYPVVAIKEIHVWKSQDYDSGYPYPTPAPYYYYDPYWYGFWPGPYWYRPLGPAYRRW
ncbi:Slp family lipoprotein [Geobacter sulfurreducens]|uniref:Slp family lipoprotein n=1 Tax=Geobacter sulfurreducens TaxID=35554 RepID=UPI000DBAF330|nr:Slp family lipoprotein [Geobacter sulfurreducens]BBA70316.1 Outer membrane protein slp [Geobacter sulfurreducens]